MGGTRKYELHICSRIGFQICKIVEAASGTSARHQIQFTGLSEPASVPSPETALAAGSHTGRDTLLRLAASSPFSQSTSALWRRGEVKDMQWCLFCFRWNGLISMWRQTWWGNVPADLLTVAWRWGGQTSHQKGLIEGGRGTGVLRWLQVFFPQQKPQSALLSRRGNNGF